MTWCLAPLKTWLKVHSEHLAAVQPVLEAHLNPHLLWFFCLIRDRGAGALPAPPGDSAPAAAGGEAAEPGHHASAQRSQPHPGEHTHTDAACIERRGFFSPVERFLGLPCSCTSATTTDEPTSTTSRRLWTCCSTWKRSRRLWFKLFFAVLTWTHEDLLCCRRTPWTSRR